MRRPIAAMLFGLLTSCANPPVEPPPAAPVVELPRAPAPTAPAPSASASAASEAQYPPVPSEILARLDPDQRTELAVIAAICQPAVADKDGKLRTGCAACARHSAPASDPAARLVPADDLHEPITHVRGAFTAKGADEHLVFTDNCTCNGCDDDAWVVRPGPAGAFVLHRRASVGSSYDCKVVHRRGQVDRPLCDRMRMRMGSVAKVVSLYDFSALPDEKERELTPVLEFAAVDNLAMSCEPGAHFMARWLNRWELRDVDRDGEEDLVIDVDVRDGVVTKEVLAACSQEDASAPPQGRLPPPALSLKLTWTATPAGFKPTAATKRHLDRLEAARKKAEE